MKNFKADGPPGKVKRSGKEMGGPRQKGKKRTDQNLHAMLKNKEDSTKKQCRLGKIKRIVG